MKLYNLLQIRKILNSHTQDAMSTTLAYKIMKFIKQTESEETFYTNKLQEIINKYAKRDENGEYVYEGDGVKIVEGKVNECNNEINDLAATDVEIPNIKFTLDELAPLSFTVADLYLLDDVIKED